MAFNQIGEANVAAQEVTGYSGEDVPVEAPSNFTLNQIIDERSAILSWNPVNPDSVQGKFWWQVSLEDSTRYILFLIQDTSKATRSRRGRRRKESCELVKWLATLQRPSLTSLYRTLSILSAFESSIRRTADPLAISFHSKRQKEVSII